jgi:uncharacterized oligopeptide transporter (OPT) family protein
MLLDAYLLCRMFDTKVFPASGTWPPGIAAAEAIKAGGQGGQQGLLLVAGLVIGMAGSWQPTYLVVLPDGVRLPRN